MLRFADRPVDGKQDFETKVQVHVGHMDTLVDANGDPDYPAINAYVKAHQEWGSGVKEHYSKVQHRKCGYCERLFTDYGDVEHYRPKSAIFTLKEEGTEKEDLNNIKGRKFNEFPEPGAYNSGYWWLSYSWNNYLVACGRCNQNWKNALFPVADGRTDRPVKGSEDTEDALLLDPFGSKDPVQHLEFTSLGAIRPFNNSPHGEQTIKVCGLWRGSVVASRMEKADKIHRKVNQLIDALDNNANPRSILEDIKGLGDERWVHAGMVRITFEQNTGWTWQDLDDWLDANP